jgi:hypothetical protein
MVLSAFMTHEDSQQGTEVSAELPGNPNPANMVSLRQRLKLEQLPSEVVPMANQICGVMISRGIEFRKEEWRRNTPKAEDWITEFKALFPEESYEP